MSAVHSEWECPGCGRRYEHPIVGLIEMGHTCRAGTTVKWRKFRRVWRSRYDKMKVR